MGRGVADRAAIEVHATSVLIAASKHHAPAEAVAALGIDEPRLEQPIHTITACSEAPPERSAGGVANAQLLDQIGIAEAALDQVMSGFGVAMELELIEGGGLVQ